MTMDLYHKILLVGCGIVFLSSPYMALFYIWYMEEKKRREKIETIELELSEREEWVWPE